MPAHVTETVAAAGRWRKNSTAGRRKRPCAGNLKAAGLAKGSGVPNKNKVGKVTKADLKAIVEAKKADLNTTDVEAAMRMIAGTARNMGIEVVD